MNAFDIIRIACVSALVITFIAGLVWFVRDCKEATKKINDLHNKKIQDRVDQLHK